MYIHTYKYVCVLYISEMNDNDVTRDWREKLRIIIVLKLSTKW